MTTGKRVLILGGGVGGLVAARQLRRRLPDEHQVVVLERDRYHLFQPSLLWMLTGDRRVDEIRRPVGRLEDKGIEVRRAEIEAIDPGNLRVRADGEWLEGDALVVALGAALRPDLLPGLTEAGYNLYSADGVRGLRDALERFAGGRVATLTAEPAYKCPAAPYEAAMLIEDVCRRRGIRDPTRIDFYAAEPGPMGVAGPEVSDAVRGMIEERGIHYHPETEVTEVAPGAGELRFADGDQASYDLLIYVPPHRAPAVTRAAGLVDGSGWVPVDRRTLETGVPSVFAVGDVTHIPLELGKPLPMAGVFAHGQAEVVARNVAASWTGGDAGAEFDGHGWCIVETGAGRAGIGKGDFYAEPRPEVEFRGPARLWHWAKIAYEKWWLWRWF